MSSSSVSLLLQGEFCCCCFCCCCLASKDAKWGWGCCFCFIRIASLAMESLFRTMTMTVPSTNNYKKITTTSKCTLLILSKLFPYQNRQYHDNDQFPGKSALTDFLFTLATFHWIRVQGQQRPFGGNAVTNAPAKWRLFYTGRPMHIQVFTCRCRRSQRLCSLGKSTKCRCDRRRCNSHRPNAYADFLDNRAKLLQLKDIYKSSNSSQTPVKSYGTVNSQLIRKTILALKSLFSVYYSLKKIVSKTNNRKCERESHKL